MIEASLDRLKNYIERENYRGYDPYDALKSPLFQLPILRSNKLIRFGTQQFVKRFPLNLRPLLLVPKGLNPVTLGLMIQGYATLVKVYPEDKQMYIERIQDLVNELQKMVPDGYSGTCWGYDFDWEARHAKIPAYQPTVVATGIITNGLFEAWQITGLDKLRVLILDSVSFILNDLNRTFEDETFCFSYSPFDRQQVFNASMKGVRLLAQSYSIIENQQYKETAKKAVQFVINHQNSDGSWNYSLASKGKWVDNYHTGYILDCLSDYIKCCNDDNYNEHFKAGYEYYKRTFIDKSGMPYFYSDTKYPVDCTAASQSIITLLRNGDIELAQKVAEWMIQHMQAENGSFYFRKYRRYTVRTSFMRWSNAWMFAALGYLMYKTKS